MKNRRQCHSLFLLIVRCLIFSSIVKHCETLNRNQPKFSPCAKWSMNGTSIFEQNNNTLYTSAVYIDRNNLIYITGPSMNDIIVWNDTSKTVVRNISAASTMITSITVADNGNIYVCDVGNDSRKVVTQWTPNGTNGTVIMMLPQSCFDLFIDRNNDIYCAAAFFHQVLKKSLNQSNLTANRVAGNGTAGYGPNLLYYPFGLFVTVDFLLYVADCGNDRVQLFRPGQTSGTTVLGNGLPGSQRLDCPYALTMDADGYLFVVDSYQNRIIGSGPYGFRCILGCSDTSNSATNFLDYPRSAYFDRNGNLYVRVTSNAVLRKFLLTTNSCEISYNRPQLSSCATWNSNGTVVAQVNNHTSLWAVFIDKNNTLYTADLSFNNLLIYPEMQTTPSRRLNYNTSYIYSCLVNNRNDIYVGTTSTTVYMATWANNYSIPILIPMDNNWCPHLFLDNNNSIYCSSNIYHKVVKRSLNSSIIGTVLVAGTGVAGSAADQLRYPRGIFVEDNLDLYVADMFNDRVQLFRSGQMNAITVAGNGSINKTIELIRPIAVTLDADGFLFITDYGNNRIVRSTPNGFKCIIGCEERTGLRSYSLTFPIAMAFDNAGHIFVSDSSNRGIRKFSLMSNSCESISSTEIPSMTTRQSEISTMISSTKMVDPITSQMIESTLLTSSMPFLTSSSSSIITKQISTEESITTVTQLRIISSTKLTLVSSTEIPSIDTFLVPTCSDPTRIGLNCNASNNPCETLHPCQNDGTCIYNHSNSDSYVCLCPSTHTGLDCQIDIRPCQSDTCLNNGTCFETSNTTFNCSCSPGWKDFRCQTMINLCEDSLCQNDAVCRPSLLNYTCKCLGTSYSGQYCEIIATRLTVLKNVSKSFASVAITAICSVILFVIMMDVLRYGFNIDPSRKVLEKLQEEKNTAKQKKKRVPPVIIHFVYVEASASAERH